MEISKIHSHLIHVAEGSAELKDQVYDALYEYYFNKGEMPYGVAKARSGDPMEWICDRLEHELKSGGLDDIAAHIESMIGENYEA